MSNIIGNPFESWVKSQVDIRQTALGQYSNINTSTLQYYSSKTPWLRLASSVNITGQTVNGVPDGSVYWKLIQAGFIKEQILGDNLAKNFILFGGAASVSDDSFTIDKEKYTTAVYDGAKSGLNYSSGVNRSFHNNGKQLFEGAYGWGGIDERGYVPMPGIESATTTYYNNGALSKATINIKCFSKAQFSLLDVLYLRPGYTLLLEFGWTAYLDGLGEIQNWPNFTTTPLDFLLNPDSFGGESNQYEMYRKISNERKLYHGNYEAVYGKVSNFKWSFNSDGTYTISVDLIGMGNIMDSLKLNVTDPDKGNGNGKSNKPEADPPITIEEFAKELFGIAAGVAIYSQYQNAYHYPEKAKQEIKAYRVGGKQIFDPYDTKTTTPSKLKAHCQEKYNLRLEEEKKASNTSQENADMNPLLANKNDTRINKIFYEIYQQFVALNVNASVEDSKIVPRVRGIKNGGCYINKTYNGERDVEGGGLALKSGYIKFAVLLKIIEDNCNLFSKKGKGSNARTKMIKFDFKYGDGVTSDTNYMLIVPPGFSTNPQMCIVPWTSPNIKGVINFKGYVSLGIQGNAINKMLTDSSDFFLENNPYVGRLANVMINLRFAAGALASTPKDEEGAISVISYLNTILQGINESMGSINNFRVIHDEDTGIIKIYDESPMPGLVQVDDKSFTTFNVFGVKRGGETSEAGVTRFQQQNTTGSFITNIGLDAEIPSNFATLISIGSQASGTNLQGNGSSFSNYNKGLIDRIIPEKIDSVESSENNEKPTPIQRAKKIWEEKISYSNSVGGSEGFGPYQEVYTTFGNDGGGGNMFNFHPDTTRNLTENYTSYIKIVHGISAQRLVMPQPFFLPFNLNLSMDGLSGMKLFEKFRITDDILPPSYEENSVDIIIKGINHEINVNTWTTTLDTLSVPRFRTKEEVREEEIEKLPTEKQKQLEEAAKDQDINNAFREYVTATPWSAAFISYVIKEAGVNFPYGGNHAIYSQKIREGGKGNPYPWIAKNPNTTKIRPGDIVVENRTGGPYKTWNTNPWTGSSHGDIVIDVNYDKGYITVVGGNVGNTVKTKTRPIYGGKGTRNRGRMKSPQNYFVVLTPKTSFRDQIVSAAKKENLNFDLRDELDRSVENQLYAYYQVAQLDAPPPSSQA